MLLNPVSGNRATYDAGTSASKGMSVASEPRLPPVPSSETTRSRKRSAKPKAVITVMAVDSDFVNGGTPANVAFQLAECAADMAGEAVWIGGSG